MCKKMMQSSLGYFKENLCLIFFTLIILSTNLFCYREFSHTCYSLTLIFLISGAAWFYRARSDRKPIGHGDLIVITGCDSGLGYNLALHCHEHLNAQVIAGVHKEDSPGAKDLRDVGITVHSLEITQKDSIKRFIQSIKNRLEADKLNLRSLVNNAGTMIFGEFEWQTDDQIHHQINVNLLGTMTLTKEILALLRLYRSRLIIVTSHCALESLPGVAAYGASKAGLAAWVTALRVEVKKYGIDVVNFIPGSFIKDSNILSQQNKQFEIMAAEMSSEAKQFYSGYFEKYAAYLSPLSQNVLPRRMKNSQLYKTFEDSLLQRYPHAIYKYEPWRYMFYHILFRISPTNIRDWLTEKFTAMPTWHENNLVSINRYSQYSSEILSPNSS